MSKRPINEFKRKAAKALRENTTTAEDILWRHLQRIEIKGSHFRRQVPIGPYIADFACLRKRLVIEVDGSQHGNNINSRRDEVRTRWLNSEGYRVLRFWNNDVDENISGVLSMIDAAVNTDRPPTPDPSPPKAGGGE